MKNKIAILSFSGGMDSSSLLFDTLNKGYKKVFCYNFDYGQRHSVEIQKAQELISYLNDAGYPVDYQLIDLRGVFSDSQSSIGANKAVDVPSGSYSNETLVVNVVENRNVIFSSIIYGKALALSKKFDSDVDIMLGVHSNDDAVYPDCRPESTNMARELFRISNYGSERINYVTPYIHVTKAEVLKSGLDALKSLGLEPEIYKHTSSCYNPSLKQNEVYACAKCSTCVDRLQAFSANNLRDPINYDN